MENEPVETIKYKGLDIKVFQDDNYDSPNDWGDNDCFLVHYHRDFQVERNDIITKSNLVDWYNGEKIDQEKKYHIFLVKAYIHSGVALALEDSGRTFPDERWDTSHSGCVLVSKEEAKTKKKAFERASGLIDIWNDNLSGNVYGYMIDEINEGCWGYYGDYQTSGLITDAKNAINFVLVEETKKHIKRVKAQIKNNVALDKRKAFSVC